VASNDGVSGHLDGGCRIFDVGGGHEVNAQPIFRIRKKNKKDLRREFFIGAYGT